MTESKPSPAPFRIALTGSLVILATMTVLSAWAGQKVGPDARIPIHWNAKGEVDGYAGPMGLWYNVFVIAGLIIVLAVVPLIEPRRGHLLRSSRAYQAVWLAIVGFMAMVHTTIVLTALGYEISINRWICIGLGGLFAVIGNYLGKTRSNFVFGIRTPWTLSSERSWNRTHRLGGRLFLLFGIVLFVAGVINANGGPLFYTLIGGMAVLVTIPLVYSYFVWKSDPDRTPSASLFPKPNAEPPTDHSEKDA